MPARKFAYILIASTDPSRSFEMKALAVRVEDYSTIRSGKQLWEPRKSFGRESNQLGFNLGIGRKVNKKLRT